MNKRQALALGSADHESGILRIRNKRPEAIWLGEPGGHWHRVPEEDLADWPDTGWFRPGELPESTGPALYRLGNLIAWDFTSGVRPDGSLSPLGFSACDAYAKRWMNTGERDHVLESKHPELASRFAEILRDREVLDFHLLETPPDGPGVVCLFSGASRATPPEHDEIELLDERPDGSVELSCSPIFLKPKDERLYVRELRSPGVVMQWAAIGKKRVPVRALRGKGPLSGLYVSLADWSEAMAAAKHHPEDPLGPVSLPPAQVGSRTR